VGGRTERVPDGCDSQADDEEPEHPEHEQPGLEPAGTIRGAIAPVFVAGVGQG
jgi:hypothetical protein